jgi:hypothetical protein
LGVQGFEIRLKNTKTSILFFTKFIRAHRPAALAALGLEHLRSEFLCFDCEDRMEVGQSLTARQFEASMLVGQKILAPHKG